MKFFLDANIPYSALDVFREFNLAAIHARDVGLSRASDEQIMEYVIKNKSILVTKDLGFANIIIFPIGLHYGLVVFRLPFFFKAIQFVNVLRNFLSSVDVILLERTITIVKLGRYRIRKV
ncbi:DUF5615 family PIN-like protein [Candidatus Woesearchaeota archaeon]|nr:DUF5615 family PIN-like protein [Candidatus Woesearchaeota archaeon]